jgi:hypothetical protein
LQQAVSAGHYPLLDADSGSGSFGAGLPAGLMNGQ